ncbi:IclR family transcriptional regulator [Amycolatopsis nigrescens]|uniref:IclR family transcriptional regulator n=1 Tax=Amycolatopsis nigrescens TaxID=381445 RepID=UPI00036E43B9|nr:IclR family transcriptional regulator [Amycolatopsis nigrescens]
MKNKPSYAIDSVDHALHLATVLQQEGALGVTEAAERLKVSRSTAHRLLAMLVYRDFAVQDPDRRYRAGPVLCPADPASGRVPVIRRAALPHLHALVEATGETANLQVLVGIEARFVASVECDQVLRVGDRSGRVLPGHLASGGKALLAALPPAEVTARYAGEGETPDLARLRRELGLIRKRGFSINDQFTETGLTAIGVAVPGVDGPPEAALSLAMPSARFDRDRLSGWVAALSAAASAIARELAGAVEA